MQYKGLKRMKRVAAVVISAALIITGQPQTAMTISAAQADERAVEEYTNAADNSSKKEDVLETGQSITVSSEDSEAEPEGGGASGKEESGSGTIQTERSEETVTESAEAGVSDTQNSNAEDSETQNSETENAATESSQTESSNTEMSETEASKIETPETEASKIEIPETESSKTETSETESSKTETSETEGSETETPETESSKTETSETEGSETETPETEGSKTETSETEGSETESNSEEESVSTEDAEIETAGTEDPTDLESAESETTETETEEQTSVPIPDVDSSVHIFKTKKVMALLNVAAPVAYSSVQDPVEISASEYRIENRDQFLGFLSGKTDYDGCTVTLACDIDMKSEIASFNGRFAGIFDGDGHSIDNVKVEQGLFPVIQASATVKNIHISNTTMTGEKSAGVIAGRNDGIITNCVVTGNLEATSKMEYTAGIAGTNEGNIENCVFSGRITAAADTADAEKDIGGIVGRNNGVIQSCYTVERYNI